MQDSAVSGSMVAEGLKFPENPTFSGVVPPQSTTTTPVSVAEVKTDKPQDIIQSTVAAEQQTQSREAYFQKNWDALASVVKEYGLEISPSDTPDYKKTFEPYFESYKTVEYLNKNPNAILDLAAKYFPDQIVRPTFDSEVQTIIAKEFGEDFSPLIEDLYKPGTDSYRYRNRMEQVEKEIRTREETKIKQQETEALERQNAMRIEFDTQYKQAMAELNMTDEQIKPYVEKVISGDPKYSTMANMVKMVMLVDGLMEIVPKSLENEGSFPVSIGSVPGGSGTGTPKNTNEWIGI